MTQPADIDPDILATRAVMAKVAPGLDVTSLPAAEARRLANKVAMVLNDRKPDLPRVDTFDIPGPAGPLRTRFYQPDGAAGRGAIYYIHGGGWFACDVDTHDRMLRFLAKASERGVFAIDYRLAPEHPYPAALEDCLAGWHWLRANAASLQADADRIAIAGDSAGANLALALTIHERNAGRPTPVGCALLQGCFAPGILTESRTRYGGGPYGLTSARLDWYWSNYLGGHVPEPPFLAAPLHADLNGLPPLYIGIAERDLSADENRLLAERLQDANNIVQMDVRPNMTHGSLQMTRDVQSARDAVTAVAHAVAAWT